MVCAFKGNHIQERFHRQSFFFINFAYYGDYEAVSAKYDHKLLMKEGDCYVGQPYSGYALRCDSAEDVVIAGVFIQRKTFLRDYLGPISSDASLVRFFWIRRPMHTSMNSSIFPCQRILQSTIFWIL